MTRSELMSRIKSTDNKSTEQRFKLALIRAGVRGWTIQPEIKERPDLAFMQEKVAVFLDGCFWHGCWIHFKPPKMQRAQWIKKIRMNRERGERNLQNLVGDGWKVFRIWEHDLKDDELLKALVLRVARAADTVTKIEQTRDYSGVYKPHGPDSFWCTACRMFVRHEVEDLTGHGVYISASCVVCDKVTRRVNGETLKGEN